LFAGLILLLCAGPIQKYKKTAERDENEGTEEEHRARRSLRPGWQLYHDEKYPL
jgi:hypothetical protein